LTKVVSTKLSNPHHDALLEMANLFGQNISEFVRESIIVRLYDTYKNYYSDELFEQAEKI
jgi:hypothetical protein